MEEILLGSLILTFRVNTTHSRSVWRALELAMSCANYSSEKRPNMSQVVIDLKECIASENSMKIKSNEIDSHDSLELSSSLEDEVVPSAR